MNQARFDEYMVQLEETMAGWVGLSKRQRSIEVMKQLQLFRDEQMAGLNAITAMYTGQLLDRINAAMDPIKRARIGIPG